MKLLIYLFLFVTHSSYAQHVLLKKDGQYIPYKKMYPFEGYVEVVNDKKERIKVFHGELLGYYNADHQDMKYLIPVTHNRISELGLIKKDLVTETKFVERVQVGKIMLYKTAVITGAKSPTPSANGGMMPGGYTTSTQYYAEKGDQFENVFIGGFNNDRTDQLRALKILVNDDPEILKKIESDDFNLTENNLLKVISEYNLKNHVKVLLHDYSSEGSIGFYTLTKSPLRDNLAIKVNDSVEYILPVSERLFPIKLPLKTPSKVCVVWDTGSSCEVIMPIPFGIQYYELKRFTKDNSFEIEKRTPRDFQNYMRSIQKN